MLIGSYRTYMSSESSVVQEKMEENRKALNADVAGYMQISKIELYPEEFEKTPTKKIKPKMMPSNDALIRPPCEVWFTSAKLFSDMAAPRLAETAARFNCS